MVGEAPRRASTVYLAGCSASSVLTVSARLRAALWLPLVDARSGVITVAQFSRVHALLGAVAQSHSCKHKTSESGRESTSAHMLYTLELAYNLATTILFKTITRVLSRCGDIHTKCDVIVEDH